MIVLDTHVWLWWVGIRTKLSRAARTAIDASQDVAVSAVSCFELALLAERKRIELDREPDLWIANALTAEWMVSLPLTQEIAVRAALLRRRGFHGDPGDRMIYATAKAHGAQLVTRDRAIRAFDPAGTIW